jgi:hypothetical protein
MRNEPQRRERLITVSDLRREAQRLINSGQMPPLEKLLAAVAEAREKYGARRATTDCIVCDRLTDARDKIATMVVGLDFYTTSPDFLK